MSSVITEFGRPVGVVYFSDDLPGAAGSWLAAAVIWRGTPGPRRWGLGRLLRQLRFRFGPSGAGFHLRGRFEPWSGSWGPNGEQETLYSSERRVVKVLGKEYVLPKDGQTLVLLVDETGGPGGSPSVRVRALHAPTLPNPLIDPLLGGEQRVDTSSDEHRVWATVLQEDPEVRAFMAEGAERE